MDNDSSSHDRPPDSAGAPDMSEFLHVFIEESSEELDHLVESVLALESDPRNQEALQKAFRMLHTLKGSCGIMGYEVVGDFAHSLEDRFEIYRSGSYLMDEAATTLVLRSIDYFRAFIARLRTGIKLEEDPTPLLHAWENLRLVPNPLPTPSTKSSRRPLATSNAEGLHISVHFREGLQLADLKARLIMARLSTIGEVINCYPPVEDTDSFEDLRVFSITLSSNKSATEVRQLAEVDGVEAIEIENRSLSQSFYRPTPQLDSPQSGHQVTLSHAVKLESSQGDPSDVLQANIPSSSSGTVRVEIERLDSLMNLTGELVIATATFHQITDRLKPAMRGSRLSNPARILSQSLRQFLGMAKSLAATAPGSQPQLQKSLKKLETELTGLENHADLWEQVTTDLIDTRAAVDQLTRVSKNLQRSVLKTRMVSVAPLFNRFKRVVRDLCLESGKQVHLLILGEKTELDKRMIDALGDPLLHIVRNCIDHGLETPAERLRLGKPEVGTLTLSASYRGNSVLIQVSDDGSGIRIERIRQKLLEQRLVTESQLSELSDPSILEYIWHPGFSTAATVTDISGRGVGLDIVRDSISRLNGTVDATSQPGQGTTFSLRLPLTLAIIHSLIVRVRGGAFSIPMDDIREIVSAKTSQIHTAHHCQTMELRGTWIPLISLELLFTWGNWPTQLPTTTSTSPAPTNSPRNVVVMQTRGMTIGLYVDELVGRSDIVIKSLAENYMAIPGLSGASILGDGEVCLMLDPTAILDLAKDQATAVQ